ncbi:MAG: hypothetical protein FWD86_03580 [Firmicutes bacterium]|nr:hypothetical protein [Bacillota bacterium]
MSAIVAKFGGSSLANTPNIKKVKQIIDADPDRKIIVVSAPGRRDELDHKITDQLLNVAKRFCAIERGFGLDPVAGHYLASRGEYMMAKYLAKILGFLFVDIESSGIVCFDKNGDVDLVKSAANFKKFKGKNIVVPGFYGLRADGEVVTFSRGGSDISGAILANIADAKLYENWTDVDGVYDQNPSKYSKAKKYTTLSYDLAQDLAAKGANVLHPDCIEFVKQKNIPIEIKNTFAPHLKGTVISKEG